MADESRLQMIAERAKRLPTLPSVYARVTELMANPKSSAAEIGQVVAHDQAIAAKLLKVVNSSFYGFKQRIGTVTRAMTMIGFRGLKELILALSVMPALKQRNEHEWFSSGYFWRHAVACAAAARAIASTLRLPNPEEIFTEGLLHDIGKLAEYQCMAEEFVQLLGQAHALNEPLYVLEAQHFGFTHAQAGEILARTWQFPDNLTEAIAFHHSPRSALRFPRDAAIVHLADILARAKMLAETYDERVPPLDMAAWERIGLQRDKLECVMRLTDEEFEKGKVFISIIAEN